MAVLHAIWTEQTSSARERRYHSLLQAALPPGIRLSQSDKEQWLHRTLRTIELAGLDPAQVLVQAVAERDMIGVRDPAAVIDSRIRRIHGSLVPLPAASWSAQVPETDDRGRHQLLTQLAAAMDDRRKRIGEHAANSWLPWAVAALGPVPSSPHARQAWQDKAAAIGAYRELSGYTKVHDPIGPEPVASTPDLRAAWHAARAALTRDDASMGRRTERWSGLLDTAVAFPFEPAHSRDAILQPPKPEIPMSPWTRERLAQRDLDREAGD